MNYLRGAVSAISAPYQYYKDLNPSTLTGAIDVIVVSRPKQSSEHDDEQNTTDTDTASGRELVCSPFHVRFGKWQVLRPGDKKVNMFVNGNPVPFPMKIGEAGEAFFVFETDEDIPQDLVTSPVLEATKPGETNAQAARAGKFGAKEDSSEAIKQRESSMEPDFLDLDAPAGQESIRGRQSASPAPSPVLEIPHTESPKPIPEEKDTPGGPSLLSRTAEMGKAVYHAAVESEKSQKDKLKDLTVRYSITASQKDAQTQLREKVTAALNVAKNPRMGYAQPDDKGDEALPDVDTNQVQGPDVTYTDDMVFDTEGYHANGHARSNRKVETLQCSTYPSTSSHSSPDRTPGPSRSPSPLTPEASSHAIPFPTFRATSEPPPDTDPVSSSPPPSHTPPSEFPSRSLSTRMRATKAKVGPHISLQNLPVRADTEEYMWEWGNFPQKTPVRTVFVPFEDEDEQTPSSRNGKGKMPAESDSGAHRDRWQDGGERKRSALSKSITADTRGTEDRGRGREKESVYGTGGRLTHDRRDSTKYRVYIEGRAVDFELSIVPGGMKGASEVEKAQQFEAGKVNYERLLSDEHLAHDESLVLRWAGDMYITRQDGSPLMDALIVWRESALRNKALHLSSRSTSPASHLGDIEEEPRNAQDATNDISEASVQAAVDAATIQGKPTSTSWVRWWSRSRPDLKSAASTPPTMGMTKDMHLEPGLVPVRRSISVTPVVPVTPSIQSTTSTPAEEMSPAPRKRYAKTLRLTSDQLKSLNLKPGANSITFSLSATGAIACTARLFVWDYEDQVVISDIDGTITKSDALGHVLTMIGRDWTHLGVAKLYTDICRNGYKILYLTSRAIGQADSTREYLKGIKQNDYQLPEGPVIMSPDRLMASLHREVIMRKPEVFKMACLRDVRRLFGTTSRNPFYAGFGNRITDALSYRSVDVPSSRIFTIDSSGEVKMELLELAGYKSSYIHMTDLVDQMFPPINKKEAPEFTDFNFWKPPMQEFPLPDLSPPSPALSARSDASNQSTLARLRNISLMGGRQASINRPSFPPPATDADLKRDAEERAKESRLRQMSSFERLSNTLAALSLVSTSPLSSPRSSTPTFLDSASEDEGGERDLEKQERPWRRSRSADSMPGSLPGSSGSSDDELQFGVDGDEDGKDEFGGGNEEEAAAEAFDDDILAAGEMANVPYLY
ncbi:LNS2-domain-containing protein [Obba rivulosa]|uniref:phosphatidate phosphatase n=1 Tax=Obba rivulosa TaxID=1052685 RepID=A0A8E2AL85_9APHY|nr:LNS2-domain-containing protein [Obba rivulosa]